jgi:hypothetical protein
MVVSTPLLFAAWYAEVTWVYEGTGGTPGAVVAAGNDVEFGVVVQPQTHASRITITAIRREYRSNLMMFNIKVTLIIVTIPIRQVLRFFGAAGNPGIQG